jgi:GDP-mannose transporter
VRVHYSALLLTSAFKFVVSGQNFSMNFLLLCIQSTVCCVCVAAVKKRKVITFRDFDVQDAKAWFPISFLLVSVIYTGSKSLVRASRPDDVCIVNQDLQQYLSIPVYTIFKNLTIILIVRRLCCLLLSSLTCP